MFDGSERTDGRDLTIGAGWLVEVNGRVAEGDPVVIVTDPEMERYAGLVAEAARDLGAVVTTCLMPVRRQDGEEPPEPVARAMAEARVGAGAAFFQGGRRSSVDPNPEGFFASGGFGAARSAFSFSLSGFFRGASRGLRDGAYRAELARPPPPRRAVGRHRAG